MAAEDALMVAAPEAATAEGNRYYALNALKAWPLTTMDGRDIKVSFAVDPVISLDNLALCGHRVEARLLDSISRSELGTNHRRKLLPADMGLIDLASLERGISRLGPSPSRTPWLITQLSFVGLSSGRVRRVLLDRAKTLQGRLKWDVICEIVDLEPGVPSDRLQEIAALARALCGAVFAQVEPNPQCVRAVRDAKLSGLTVRASDLGADEAEITKGMRRFGAFAVGAAPVITVTNLPSQRLVIEAHAAGFTHATIRASAISKGNDPTVNGAGDMVAAPRRSFPG